MQILTEIALPVITRARQTFTGTGTVDTSVASQTVTGTGTLFSVDVHVGDRIIAGTKTWKVIAVTSDTELTVQSLFGELLTGATFTVLPAAAIILDQNGNIGLIVDDQGKVVLDTIITTPNGDGVFDVTLGTQALFHSAGATPSLYLQSDDNSYMVGFEVLTDGGKVVCDAPSQDARNHLSFWNGSTPGEKMRVLGQGRVGINKLTDLATFTAKGISAHNSLYNVSVTIGSNEVNSTGGAAQYLHELSEGDTVIINGETHVVDSLSTANQFFTKSNFAASASNQVMQITPAIAKLQDASSVNALLIDENRNWEIGSNIIQLEDAGWTNSLATAIGVAAGFNCDANTYGLITRADISGGQGGGKQILGFSDTVYNAGLILGGVTTATSNTTIPTILLTAYKNDGFDALTTLASTDLFAQFSNASSVPLIDIWGDGDTDFYGNITAPFATFTNVTDGASVQAAILQGDRATPADGDTAYLTLKLSDSAGNQDEQARISWKATTVLSGATQDGDLILSALYNGTLTPMLTLDGSADQIVSEVAHNFAARILGKQGADVASANDLTLGADGNFFEITNATQINAITTTDWQNGSTVSLFFTSTPTVKHNTAGGAGTAVILLAGASDFAATAGDTLTLILSEIGGVQAWRELSRTAI